MIEFKYLKIFNPQGEEELITIASGPVIIQDNQVLLDKHDDDFWKFPGGKVLSNESFEQTAIREVKEELNVDVELKSEPYIIILNREVGDKKETLILIHYLAEIINGEPQAGRDITEFEWHDIDNLPSNCAENIKPVVDFFRNKI